MEFDYSKLRGRIIEKFQSLFNFSEVIDITYESLSKKMNNKTAILQSEIIKWCELLEIPVEEIGIYFFKVKVQ